MSSVGEYDVTELQTATESAVMHFKKVFFVEQHQASKWITHISENFEKSTYIKKGVCILERHDTLAKVHKIQDGLS